MNNPQGQPVPKFALLCEAGAEGPALAGRLKQLLANAQAPFPVTVEEKGGLVVVAAGAKGWGAAQKPGMVLAGSQNFTAALGQVQKTSVAAVYVDVEGVVKLVDALAGGGPQAPSWVKARDLLGLGGVRRFIWTAGFDGKDWMNRAFVDAPAPRNGAIPKMLESTPLSQEILRAIPQTATVAGAGKFDLGGLVKGIRSAVSQMHPEVGQEIDNGLQQVKQMLGVDIQADLLDALGDEWAVYVDPMTAGQGMFGFSLVNRARDAAKLENSLTRLEGFANAMMQQNMAPEGMSMAFKQTKADGTTLHHLTSPIVSPAWAVRDGNLYMGLYPQVVEAAAAHVAGKGKSILENEDFVAVRKRLGDVPASGVSFANLPKTAPDGYQEILLVMRTYLGFADLFGADTPALVLPPIRKIMPELTPAGSVSWTDAAGWHAKSVSPFPGSTALTPGGGGQVILAQQGLALSIILPSLNRARETANRVKCGSNLRQIGQGIFLYSNENRGKFPPDLGTLVKTGPLSAQVFVCPSGETTVPSLPNPDAAVKWVNENSDYVYIGAGRDTRIGADVIVCYEKPGAHGGQGMNLLFGDGHVEWMAKDEALKRIEDQQTGRKGGGGL
jgi:prepilin-type processing-associated H-X9-DG protein